jgi:hypothetical protein
MHQVPAGEIATPAIEVTQPPALVWTDVEETESEHT